MFNRRQKEFSPSLGESKEQRESGTTFQWQSEYEQLKKEALEVMGESTQRKLTSENRMSAQPGDGQHSSSRRRHSSRSDGHSAHSSRRSAHKDVHSTHSSRRSADKDERYARDLSGVKFGQLTVLEETGRYNAHEHRIWRCICVCGRAVEVSRGQLLRRQVTDCGNPLCRRRLSK